MKNLLTNETKCLIIQSEFSEFSFWNYVDVCKIVGAKYPSAPLGLLTVAALLPQNWSFKLVDANIEPVLAKHFEWADILCLGGMLPQQSSMLSLIDQAHKFGLPVVVGGPDPTSQPHLYQSADYLVLGEGEVTIPLFLADLDKGLTHGQYQSDLKANMTQAVIPRFDLIRFKDYLQVGIQFSRGCPFCCEFCNIVELFGRTPRTKLPEQMLKELEKLYDLGYRGHVDIVDDNFIGNKKNAKTVLTAIKEWSEPLKYPFYFSTECSINLAEDENLMQLMKDIDFRYVFVGIETPEESALVQTKKIVNVNKHIAETIKRINSYGIIVNAGFIIGFDKESDHIADNMIRCIQDSGIAMAMVGLLYALPNTALSRRLKSEGRLFEASSIPSSEKTKIDQTTSGLNFLTTRQRIDILTDYLIVESIINDPKKYFSRVTRTAIALKCVPRFKPTFVESLKTGLAFIKVNHRLLKNRSCTWPYFKMFLVVLFGNPKGLSSAVNLSAMFIHFQKQSKFTINHIANEIEEVMILQEKSQILMPEYNNQHNGRIKKFLECIEMEQ